MKAQLLFVYIILIFFCKLKIRQKYVKLTNIKNNLDLSKTL